MNSGHRQVTEFGQERTVTSSGDALTGRIDLVIAMGSAIGQLSMEAMNGCERVMTLA
jgi:hypothetical protein